MVVMVLAVLSSFCAAFQSFTRRVIRGTVSCFTFVYSFCTRIHSLKKIEDLVEQITLPQRTRSFFSETILSNQTTHYYGVQDDRGLK